MGAEKFTITKLGYATRLQYLLDGVLKEDTVFNKSMNYYAAGEVLIINSKQNPNTDIKIKFADLTDDLGAANMEAFIALIQAREYFNSQALNVIDVVKTVGTKINETYTILKGFLSAKIEWESGGAVTNSIDGIAYDATIAKVVKFSAEESTADIILIAGAGNNVFVTEIR